MSLDTSKCKECGVKLNSEHFMKIIFDDGSSETIPLTICPECFKNQMAKIARNKTAKSNEFRE